VSPVLLGQEHLPGLVGSSRPLLFVGNHQKMGLYDVSGKVVGTVDVLWPPSTMAIIRLCSAVHWRSVGGLDSVADGAGGLNSPHGRLALSILALTSAA
jgi:hypothetical protein